MQKTLNIGLLQYNTDSVWEINSKQLTVCLHFVYDKSSQSGHQEKKVNVRHKTATNTSTTAATVKGDAHLQLQWKLIKTHHTKQKYSIKALNDWQRRYSESNSKSKQTNVLLPEKQQTTPQHRGQNTLQNCSTTCPSISVYCIFCGLCTKQKVSQCVLALSLSCLQL